MSAAASQNERRSETWRRVRAEFAFCHCRGFVREGVGRWGGKNASILPHLADISVHSDFFSYLLAGWGEVRYGKKIKHGPRSAGPEPLSHSLLAECCQSKHGGCYCRGHVHAVEIILPNEPAFKATVNGGSNNLEERFLWHTHTHTYIAYKKWKHAATHAHVSMHLASANRELPGIHFHPACSSSDPTVWRPNGTIICNLCSDKTDHFPGKWNSPLRKRNMGAGAIRSVILSLVFSLVWDKRVQTECPTAPFPEVKQHRYAQTQVFLERVLHSLKSKEDSLRKPLTSYCSLKDSRSHYKNEWWEIKKPWKSNAMLGSDCISISFSDIH